MLIDSARITVRAGSGGNGCVAFRREKYVPHGGPAGGDGGRGGNVVLLVNHNFNTLLHLHNRRLIHAENGRNGLGSNKTGAAGADIVIDVPPGTVVYDADSRETLADLTGESERFVIARGGRGGRGNARFSSSTNRVPRRADDGQPGEEQDLDLELKLMADLGLVGLPNAGKSTLLSRLSAARPKIADYPFTTLEPYLGVVQAPGDDFRTLVMADIPGLIEGAHEGAGLGIQFLRHIERCRAIVHLIDLSEEESSIEERATTIREELSRYGQGLEGKPWILVGTKLDMVSERDPVVATLSDIAASFGVEYRAISAITGEGLPRLMTALFDLSSAESVEIDF